MKTLNLAKKIAQIAISKKAEDVIIINIKRFTVISDYFVILTATSEPHRKTLMEEIEKKTEASFGFAPLHVDGKKAPGWTAIDYGAVIVHIFSKSQRALYQLEKLYYAK